MEKRQAFVDVFDLVDSHLSIVGLGKFLARDDLQELEEFLAVGKVHKQVFHLHTSLRQCIIMAARKRSETRQLKQHTENNKTKGVRVQQQQQLQFQSSWLFSFSLSKFDSLYNYVEWIKNLNWNKTRRELKKEK